MIEFRRRSVSRGLEVREATIEAFQKQLTDYDRKPNAKSALDDGWLGDIPEREWCKAVLAAIADKVDKIQSYRQAQCHDILIYSNHPTDPVRGVNGKYPEYKQLQMCAQQSAAKWKLARRLGIISVIDGRTLLYDLIGQCARWKVVDLRRAQVFPITLPSAGVSPPEDIGAMQQISFLIGEDISSASLRLRREVERLEVSGKRITCVLYPPSLAENFGVAEFGGRRKYDGHIARAHLAVPYEIIIQFEHPITP
jgi:hypothetical protein